MYTSGLYQKFDYGASGNRLHYSQPTPPIYPLGNFPMDVPLAVFTGGKDELADPTDTAALLKMLPKRPELLVNIPAYAHLDFVWSTTANNLVYQPLINFFSKYN